MAEKVRIDKWLWSVRIYKSRTLASDTCRKGHVRIGDDIAKPSTLVEVGQMVHCRKEGYNLELKVLKVISKRVSAVLAQECYENLTPEEEMHKYDSWYVGKGRSEIRERGAGRPTKRQRREIDDFKGDYSEDDLQL